MVILSEKQIVLSPHTMSSRTWRDPNELPRSSGVHVSAVNQALAIAAGKLDEVSPFEKFSSTNYPLLPALGVAWEELRASHYSELELIWHPYELERDSIFGTPDGLYLAGLEETFWECKFTFKKIQRITDCWLYMKQGLSYCAMSNGRINRVLYDVCWALGDYQRPYQPAGTSTLVQFSDLEIESWWKAVRGAAVSITPERN